MMRSLLTVVVAGTFFVMLSARWALAVISPNDLPRIALHAQTISKLDGICTTANPNAQGLACVNYNTRANLFTGTYVYIVVGQGPDVGVNGTSFGIDYNPQLNAVNYISFTQCTDGQAFLNDGGNGDFPAACGGIRITWDTCQEEVIECWGVHAVVGSVYMYAYGNDVMSVTPNNNVGSGPELAVVTCGSDMIQILEELAFDPSLVPLTLGRVQFGVGYAGYTPCGLRHCDEHTPTHQEAAPSSRLRVGAASSFCSPSPVLPTTWGKIKSRY